MTYEGYSDYFEKKVIVSVALTGALHGKEANPNLPEQPEEIAEDVAACREAGASIVHLHARDDDGDPTQDPERFQEIRDRVGERCDDIVVNFTTAGTDITDDRIRPILETEPRPELASLDLGPMSVGMDTTAHNTRQQNIEFAEKMRDVGVKPELEIFNNGHVSEMQYLVDEGLLEKPYWASPILGMQTGTPPHPRELLNLVQSLPEETEWQCIAIGRHQLPLTTMALTLGGHIRVGLEDNVYYRSGELAESNRQLVERAVRIANELERPVATPDEAREILGL